MSAIHARIPISLFASTYEPFAEMADENTWTEFVRFLRETVNSLPTTTPFSLPIATPWSDGLGLSTSCIGGTRARSAAPSALRGAEGVGGPCAPTWISPGGGPGEGFVSCGF